MGIISWNESSKAVKALQEGKLVAFPTETVYGIGAIANNENAYRLLCQAKNRPEGKPFTLMCANLGQVASVAKIDARIVSLMKAFMPGPLTLLLPARKNLPPHAAENGVVGVRVPDDEAVRNLIEKVGCPLLVPSANKSGEKELNDPKSIAEAFGGDIEWIIDGEIKGGVPSTIIDLSKGEPRLVRPGAITLEQVQKVYSSKAPYIALGADHGGYLLKEKIKKHLEEMRYQVLDCGTNSTDSCDYPLFGQAVGKAVASQKAELGVVVCTSGEGIMMAANKIKGVRAGIGYGPVVSQKMREHNDANVISFGAAYMKEEDVLLNLDIFLSEKFSPLEKHHRRVNLLEK